MSGWQRVARRQFVIVGALALAGGMLLAAGPPAAAAASHRARERAAMTPSRSASAAQSTWSIQSSAQPTAPQGNLYADACAGKRFCLAVGSYDDSAGVQASLAEAWNGSTWSLQSTPNPAGSTDTELHAVSCLSASDCVAVGYYRDSSDDTFTLAEVWNGTTWSIQSTPNPSPDVFAQLQGVSCSAVDACTAVGLFQFNSLTDLTLAESWNGSTWTIQTTINPPGAPQDYTSDLARVSCPTNGHCVAVGSYTGINFGSIVTLAERWNGSTWTAFPSVDPAGSTQNKLNGVSCRSATHCIAVGYTFGSGVEATLALHLTGSNWTIQSTPNPAGTTNSLLNAVSCSSDTSCDAVGFYVGPSGVVAFAESMKSATWSLETTASAPGTTASDLDGVACTSAGACTAAGFADNPAGANTLAERWNGSAWSVQTTVDPAGPQAQSQLEALSCRSASACTAVGTYQSSSGTGLTLAEVWNGTTWTIQPTPDPAAAPFPGSELDGVSCTSTAACTAVGLYSDPSGTELTLAEGWNGSAWSLETTPSPAGATYSTLTSVSCTSASSCVAVGWSFDSSGTETALIETWNGSSWSMQIAPSPTGATGAELSGVSCSSAIACTAVGSYNDASGTQLTLAEAWSGTGWSIQSTPDPSGATASTLGSVSCHPAGFCTATGNDYGVSGTSVTLAERWDGSAWTIQTTRNPAGATASFLNGGVSCDSTTSCTAVGYYNDSSNDAFTLAEHWNGSSWTLQTTPNPSGATLSEFTGVACVAGGTCTAAGYSTASLFNPRTLVETNG